MRSPLLSFALFGLFVASPLSAQTISYEAVDVDADYADHGGERSLPLDDVAPALAALPDGAAAYGPFRVLDQGRAALVDVTGTASPAQFAAMLRDHPGIATIEMLDCPGTEDDLANLRLGRMIRERGIAMHVPDGGSVRSGAVELFLAGARRLADPGAEFAVHSWQDDAGREPGDYAAAAPENRRYLDYYRQMGMSGIEAEAFYAMTNSVPFDSARWFGTGVMQLWIDLDHDAAPGLPTVSAPDSALLAPQSAPQLLDSVVTLQ